MTENGFKGFLKKYFLKILKATILTSAIGFFLLLIWWFFILGFFADNPEIQTLFAVLVWSTLFFTFTVRATEGTIYKYGFLVGRALFIIVYLIYATNGGVFSLDFADFRFWVEFVPLLALMVFINILDMARSVLQALEFTSETPKE